MSQQAAMGASSPERPSPSTCARSTENARTVVSALPGIDVVGVTKVTCGSPEVARAMLAGGVVALGDSRLENIARMRDAGIDAPFWLLRAPTPGLADETVRLADVSLESEIETVEALDAAAARAGRTHAVMAMVDVGDLREGMMPAELPAFLARAAALENIDDLGHRHESHLLRRDRPHRGEPGRARRRSRERPSAQLGQTTHRLRWHVELDRAGGRGPHALGSEQPAHRREHPARREHRDPRADPGTAHRRDHASRRR